MRYAAPFSNKRQKIVGTVTKVSETQYKDRGQHAPVNRPVMTIDSGEGWKAHGTVPKGLDPQVGDRVELVCLFNNPVNAYFGFYSRPAKAKKI